MPCYPALALLLGYVMASDEKWSRYGTRALGVITSLCAIAAFMILVQVRQVPTPGDISMALTRNPSPQYSLSLGHMLDLTLDSFAYLRGPFVVAGIAFLIGAVA